MQLDILPIKLLNSNPSHLCVNRIEITFQRFCNTACGEFNYARLCLCTNVNNTIGKISHGEFSDRVCMQRGSREYHLSQSSSVIRPQARILQVGSSRGVGGGFQGRHRAVHYLLKETYSLRAGKYGRNFGAGAIRR